jgi:hypothetical protein
MCTSPVWRAPTPGRSRITRATNGDAMSGYDLVVRLVKKRITGAAAFDATARRIVRDAALNSSRY